MTSVERVVRFLSYPRRGPGRVLALIASADYYIPRSLIQLWSRGMTVVVSITKRKRRRRTRSGAEITHTRFVVNFRDPRTGRRKQYFFERHQDAVLPSARPSCRARHAHLYLRTRPPDLTIAQAVAYWLEARRKRGEVRSTWRTATISSRRTSSDQLLVGTALTSAAAYTTERAETAGNSSSSTCSGRSGSAICPPRTYAAGTRTWLLTSAATPPGWPRSSCERRSSWSPRTSICAYLRCRRVGTGPGEAEEDHTLSRPGRRPAGVLRSRTTARASTTPSRS